MQADTVDPDQICAGQQSHQLPYEISLAIQAPGPVFILNTAKLRYSTFDTVLSFLSTFTNRKDLNQLQQSDCVSILFTNLV